MSLKIAFQMEPLAEVNPTKNSTLWMMRSAQARGHVLYQYHPRELGLDGNKVIARARKVTLHDNDDAFYTLGEDEWLNLAEIDVVQVRQDPPFNMEYITATYMLEKIHPDTLVVNNPRALRDYPEKIFPMEFAEYTPHTLVTEDPEAVKRFLAEEQDIIIKPLYLFGGQGVFRATTPAEVDEIVAQLVAETQAPIVTQPFLPEVKLGDKRILIIDGKPIAAFNRVPEDGSVRANLMQGGSLQPAEITAHEQEICEKLGPRLQQEGVFICGIDMIGEYLTEINITSPIGFQEIPTLYDIDISAILWEAIERHK